MLLRRFGGHGESTDASTNTSNTTSTTELTTRAGLVDNTDNNVPYSDPGWSLWFLKLWNLPLCWCHVLCSIRDDLFRLARPPVRGDFRLGYEV